MHTVPTLLLYVHSHKTNECHFLEPRKQETGGNNMGLVLWSLCMPTRSELAASAKLLIRSTPYKFIHRTIATTHVHAITIKSTNPTPLFLLLSLPLFLYFTAPDTDNTDPFAFPRYHLLRLYYLLLYIHSLSCITTTRLLCSRVVISSFVSSPSSANSSQTSLHELQPWKPILLKRAQGN